MEKIMLIGEGRKVLHERELHNITSDSLRIADGVEVICNSAFKGKKIRKIIIPNSVTIIEDDAFAKCHFLKIVELGNNIVSIGERAFKECSFLESIKLPKSLKKIEDHTFQDCDNLININLENVSKIGDHAFDCCYELRRINLDSIEYIGDSAFAYCDLREVIFPNHLVTCGKSPFYTNINLKNVIINGTIKQHNGNNAIFGDCDSLSKITLSNNEFKNIIKTKFGGYKVEVEINE